MRYTKDIIKKKGISLKYLPWDSKFFNINSYFLSIDGVPKFSGKLLEKSVTRLKKSFITAKINTALIDGSFLDDLQNNGFKYINTEITLKFHNEFYTSSFLPEEIEVKKLNRNIFKHHLKNHILEKI